MKITIVILLLSIFQSCRPAQDLSNKEIVGSAESFADPLFETEILAMLQDRNGDFWIGSNREGLAHVQEDSTIIYTMEDGLPANQIWSLEEDELGNIWMQTGRGGVARIKDGVVTNYTGNDVWTSQVLVEEEWPSEAMPLWFAAGHPRAAYYFDGQDLRQVPHYFEPKDSVAADREHWGYEVYALDVASDGRAWFGTVNHGVMMWDGEEMHFFNDDWPAMRAVFEDRDGVMWFGNNGKGVQYYDGQRLRDFTAEHKLGSWAYNMNSEVLDSPGTLARVWAIDQGQDGDMWFATTDAGLWRWDGEQVVNYGLEDGLTSLKVTELYVDRSGQVWAGLGDGSVRKWSGGGFERVW